MNEFHFLGAVFALLIIVMLAIRALAPRTTPWEQVHSGDLDMTPYKHARLAGSILIGLVLLIYALFASF